MKNKKKLYNITKWVVSTILIAIITAIVTIEIKKQYDKAPPLNYTLSKAEIQYSENLIEIEGFYHKIEIFNKRTTPINDIEIKINTPNIDLDYDKNVNATIIKENKYVIIKVDKLGVPDAIRIFLKGKKELKHEDIEIKSAYGKASEAKDFDYSFLVILAIMIIISISFILLIKKKWKLENEYKALTRAKLPEFYENWDEEIELRLKKILKTNEQLIDIELGDKTTITYFEHKIDIEFTNRSQQRKTTTTVKTTKLYFNIDAYHTFIDTLGKVKFNKSNEFEVSANFPHLPQSAELWHNPRPRRNYASVPKPKTMARYF